MTSANGPEARPVLRVREQVLTQVDILAWADAVGLLPGAWHHVADALAAQRQAEATNRLPAAGTVQLAADDWRQRLRLTTAADTREWFTQHELDLDHLTAFLTRRLCQLQSLPRQPETITPAEIAAVIWEDLVLCAAAGPLIEAIIWRCLLTEPTSGVAPLPPARWPWPNAGGWQLRESQFSDRLLQLVSADRRLTFYHRLYPLLVVAEVDQVVFAGIEAAREAYLGLADGQALEGIAARAEVRCRPCRYRLLELPPEVGGQLLAAGPGACLAPLADVVGWRLLRFRQRHSPDLQDPEVGRAVDTEVLRLMFADTVQAQVQYISWQPDARR